MPLRQDFINVLTRSRHAHVGSSTRETNCNKILPSPTFVVRISTRHSLSPKSTTRKIRKENSMFRNKTYVTPQVEESNTHPRILVIKSKWSVSKKIDTRRTVYHFLTLSDQSNTRKMLENIYQPRRLPSSKFYNFHSLNHG